MDFKEHLLNSLPSEEVRLLLNSFSQKDEHAVLLNLYKISDEEFVKEFPLVKPHKIVPHAYIYDKEVYPLGKHLYHELGYYYLQDPSAMVSSSLIDFKENDLVLDLCAAPGGKSVQASLKMNGKGLIVSNDISTSRANLISNNAERLGLRNLLIVNNDFSKVSHQYQNTFDKIILDAPCSGSGMFRKNELMESDWSINKVEKFAQIQKELILMSYDMLKEGGLLSYSTCSYSMEEDEEVIEYLLNNRDAKIEQISIEGGYINPKKPLGIRLHPSHFEGEGQYICHIRKPGTLKETIFKNKNSFKEYLVSSFDNSDVQKYGDYLFALSNSFNTKNLHVIRYGVKVGELNKNYFKFDLHYARSLNKSDKFPRVELTLEEVKQYLQGNVIRKDAQKGYVAITYKDNVIDITKNDGMTIKNNYPKGLRKRF